MSEERRANGWIQLESPEDAREILELLEAQDDFFVVHLRRFVYGAEFLGLFPDADNCAECEADLIYDAFTYMWGEPSQTGTLAEAKNSRFAALRFFCSEEHAEAYTDRWAGEVGFPEYATAYHAL